METSDAAGYGEPSQQCNAAFSLGDLKREEEILISLYSKMKDQLHKLEVEELELKQKIRRKELNEATGELYPPQSASNSDTDAEDFQPYKGKGCKKDAKEKATLHRDTASRVDNSLPVSSALSYSSPNNLEKMSTTHSQQDDQDALERPSPANNLTIPSFEPDKSVDLDLSALNSFNLPHFQQTNDIESEDD
ncbi:uncharacterized protein [Watersipora subatra]|uniref:uncharacterized protein isoform X1 n=1 Tax=Watersipora subatra TaxID=2589382 RepID=UPI00355C0427